MTTRDDLVAVLKEYFGTISTNRVSAKTLRSDGFSQCLADMIIARVHTLNVTKPVPAVSWDYWVEHSDSNGNVYRSSNLSQAGGECTLEMFEHLILQEIEKRADVRAITLYRGPLALGGREKVKDYVVNKPRRQVSLVPPGTAYKMRAPF